MKEYTTLKNLSVLLLLTVSLFFASSCVDEDAVKASGQKDNFSLDLGTRAGELADLIPNIQLYTFYNGGTNNSKFHKEIVNITRTATQLSAPIEVGRWHMAMIAPPTDAEIIKPVGGVSMDELPMYVYAPQYDNAAKRHKSAAELFFINKAIPEIIAGQSVATDAQLSRNVAKIRLKLNKTTANFDINNTTHVLKLHDVASTISYTGKILPDVHNPTTLDNPLEARVTLKPKADEPGFLTADVVEFIIPAHRGTDFLAANPTDIIKQPLSLTVDLARAGGTSRFTKTVVIPEVPRCNSILEVNITVNDGLLFNTKILDWERVDLDGTVGDGYKNWLYVKKGASGTGQSWSDAAPDINTAIRRAQSLLTDNKAVHGILVAGASNITYSENIYLHPGIKLYGGWVGQPGTELDANDPYAPYKSTDRNLKSNKAKLELTGNNRVTLDMDNTLLDGFIIDKATVSSGSLVTISKASAAINAVEITNNTTAVASTLKMTAGTASNVLITNNASGISVTNGAKLVNATVASNTGASNITGAVLLNSAFWKSSRTGTASTVSNCAMDGAVYLGTANVGLNANNTAWFAVGNAVPGPHFVANTNNTHKYYEALNDRCPLIGRGSQSNFDSNTPYIPANHKKDIDGKERHVVNNSTGGTPTLTDIGCYEAAGLEGFSLEWATDAIYVSYQAKYISEYPLILPNNDTYEIGVDWTAKWTPSVSTSAYPSLTNTRGGTIVSSTTGGGTGMVVGSLFFRNGGNTPTVDDYNGAERTCGTIRITTNLGNYLPDTDIRVVQLPGKEYKLITGYVGSFHRNKEVGARNIAISNTGAWSARIISGLDWIKIDGNLKTHGRAITDPDEGTPPAGANRDTHYREVEQVWKGVISGTGNIQFRVGMQGKNTTGSPRYGLIAITTSQGVSMFFVRQGEQADYLYRAGDDKPNNNARTNLVKVSPYNLTDPNKNSNTAGSDLKAGGGRFVDYPTKVGYYFQWNQTIAYKPGQTHTFASARNASWSTSREVCPAGYRQPSHVEFINSLYYNMPTPTNLSDTSPELTIDPIGDDVKKNALWGAYADGYYDQLATTPLSTASSYSVGSGGDMATKGTLMVNHYNYSSVFYPGGGRMSTNSLTNTPYSMYYTTTYYYGDPNKGFSKGYYRGSNSHWQITSQTSQHIGMNCTPILYNYAATTRCVTK